MRALITGVLCAALVVGPGGALAAPAGKSEHVRPVRKRLQRCVAGCKRMAQSSGTFLRKVTRVRRGTATRSEQAEVSPAMKTASVAAMLGGFATTVAARAYGFHLAELQLPEPAWLDLPREGGVWILAAAAVALFQLHAQTPAQSGPANPPAQTPAEPAPNDDPPTD